MSLTNSSLKASAHVKRRLQEQITAPDSLGSLAKLQDAAVQSAPEEAAGIVVLPATRIII
eukprot:767125-Hanusia_phi.AAC.8